MKKLLFILSIFPLFVSSQIWEKELLDKNPNATFYERKIAFESYRDQYPDYKGYTPYARKLDFLEKRLNKYGVYPEDKLFREWQSEKNKYNENLSYLSNWQELGPFSTPYMLSQFSSVFNAGNGRVNTIEFDPFDPNIIWVGASSGGLWKTVDGGINWTTNTDNLPVISISSISINPNNTQEMLIATGDGIQSSYTSSRGVLRSTDGGINWDTTGLNSQVYKLEINQNYPDSIFAGIQKHIMLSVDGGISWDSVYSVPPFSWGTFVDIEFMPGNTNIIYAAYRNGGESTVYRSMDGGVTWVIIENGFLPDRSNIEIAVTNANPDVVYAVFEYNDNYHGLYKSIDMGDNWVLQSDSPNVLNGQAWYNLSLAVDPTDESNVWVGGISQYNSIDDGQNWNVIGGVHADQHYAEFNPLNNTLFVANDGGIYKYINNNFINISDDLRITQFYKLGISTTNPDKLVGGAQDNGTIMLHNGISSHILQADGMECVIDKFNENKIFSCTQNGFLRRCDDISLPNFTWNFIKPINSGIGQWVTPYELHPMNNNMIVAGYGQVYRSFDSGDNWQVISNFNPANLINEIAMAPSDTNYIYLSRYFVYDSIMITKNSGLTWQSKTLPTSYKTVSDILVSPDDPEVIWITYSSWDSTNKILKSTDAGDSWTDISGNNLPSVPVLCIVYQDNAKEDLYIGTDLGVYHRDSTMSDWMPYMNGLPNVAVTELEIHYGSHKIRASTYGRGIWESNLYSLPSTFNELHKSKSKNIIKIKDLLGRETKARKNILLFYIYDDGTVEKKIILE